MWAVGHLAGRQLAVIVWRRNSLGPGLWGPGGSHFLQMTVLRY